MKEGRKKKGHTGRVRERKKELKKFPQGRKKEEVTRYRPRRQIMRLVRQVNEPMTRVKLDEKKHHKKEGRE